MDRKRRLLFVLLCACLLIVLIWQVAAYRARGPMGGFEMTAADFAAFRPASAEWLIDPIESPVDDPTAPNIVSYFLAGRGGRGGVLVRLVHGYNMPMCMKIKGYKVELIAGDLAGSGRQVWRLTSASQHVSIWATQMLLSGDMTPSYRDVRTMAFPRVGSPDDPNWFPGGFTVEWVRHPVLNTRRYFRARWNAARCDLLTFLGLRRPAWASDEELILVAATKGASVEPANEAAAIKRVVDGHTFMLSELQRFKRLPPQAPDAQPPRE